MWERFESAGISCEGRGAGRVVVLLHGLPSPVEELKSLGLSLGEGFRVLVPSMPGYVRGGWTPGAHGEAAIADRLARLVEGECGGQPVALVGYSMGAYRALSLALREGVRASAVVALAGFGDLSVDERAGMRAFAGALRAGQDLRALAGPRFLSSAFRRARPDQVASVEAWLSLAPREVLAEELDDVATAPSLLPRLGGLGCNLTAIVGSEDVAMPVSHSRRLAEAAGGALHVVDGAGHALLTESFDEVARLVTSALVG